jgi:hypothetical protein
MPHRPIAEQADRWPGRAGPATGTFCRAAAPDRPARFANPRRATAFDPRGQPETLGKPGFQSFGTAVATKSFEPARSP